MKISGLEAFDGTPLLDIKPYKPDNSILDARVPRWFSDLNALTGKSP
jgi:tRNA (Thr-GGU) A37 N-methylase